MNILKYILLIFVLYLSTSIGEFIIHKYGMHNITLNKHNIPGISNHLDHHSDVHYDMTLNENHNDRGMYFMTSVTIILGIIVFLIYYFWINIIFKLKLDYKYIILISFIISIGYKLLWNNVHYKFHMLGKPFNQWTKYEKLLFRNHTYHHLQKGKTKGNYNIIFLGADYLFGQYNTCLNNKEYCDSLNGNNKLCNYQKNKIVPNKFSRYGIKYCD